MKKVFLLGILAIMGFAACQKAQLSSSKKEGSRTGTSDQTLGGEFD